MKKALLLSLSVFYIGCTTNSNQPSILPEPQTIIPTLILQGELYGAGQENIAEQRTVITNQTAFDALQMQMSIVNNTQFPPTVPVNFTTDRVLAVFDQVQGYGGYTIRVTNLQETATQIIATIVKTSPQGFATTVITQPYHIVKIPISSKPIIFN